MGSNLPFPRGASFLLCLCLCLCITSSSSPLPASGQSYGDEQEHHYLRFADVERHCQPVLSATAELGGAHCARCLRTELAFEKGDWRQDDGRAPLMPFDAGDVPPAAPGPAPPDPLRLATFALTHVDAERGGRTAVNASGVLVLSISRKVTKEETGHWLPTPPVGSPEFELSPGSTRLKILFEGVYTERRNGVSGGDGDGERLLCMVGSAVLPTRNGGGDGADPWDRGPDLGGRSKFRPPVTADGNILLVLRFPEGLTLTTRAVHGEMMSTNAVSDAAYFDAVRINSRLSSYTPYELFRSDELVATACSPWPSRDMAAVAKHAGELSKGISLCDVFNGFGYGSILAVVPDRRCSSTDSSSCRQPGPFATGMAAGVAVALQDLQCHRSSETDAAVSAVFRAFSPSREDWLTAVQRTVLDGTTISAEGVWTASAGQACMVGCLGAGKKACHYRVCLYVKATFSATRRRILLARITGINGTAGETLHPLLLEERVPPLRYWGYSSLLHMVYNYTLVSQAGELRRRSKSRSRSSFSKLAAKSLSLSYPNTERAGYGASSLFSLVGELTLRFTTVPELPDLFPTGWIERPMLELEMLAVDNIVGPISQTFRDDFNISSLPVRGRSDRLLNVAAELRVIAGKPSSGWITALSLEGVYGPEDGRMYLVGCRDVRRHCWT